MLVRLMASRRLPRPRPSLPSPRARNHQGRQRPSPRNRHLKLRVARNPCRLNETPAEDRVIQKLLGCIAVVCQGHRSSAAVIQKTIRCIYVLTCAYLLKALLLALHMKCPHFAKYGEIMLHVLQHMRTGSASKKSHMPPYRHFVAESG